MKTLFGIFLVMMVLGTAAAAQSAGDPPAAIFSAPKAAEIKEFVSEEDKFKVDFPGTPREAALHAHSNSYIVSRAGSVAMIIVNEFPQDLDKKNNGALLLAAIMKSNSDVPEMKISDEKDITLGNHKAKEFTSTYTADGGTYSQVRLIAAGKRMYQLNYTAQNWPMLSEQTKKEFAAEAKRFFDSFKLIEKK